MPDRFCEFLFWNLQNDHRGLLWSCLLGCWVIFGWSLFSLVDLCLIYEYNSIVVGTKPMLRKGNGLTGPECPLHHRFKRQNRESVTNNLICRRRSVSATAQQHVKIRTHTHRQVMIMQQSKLMPWCNSFSYYRRSRRWAPNCKTSSIKMT